MPIAVVPERTNRSRDSLEHPLGAALTV